MEGLEEKLNQKERIRKIMKKNVQKKVGKKEIILKITEKKWFQILWKKKKEIASQVGKLKKNNKWIYRLWKKNLIDFFKEKKEFTELQNKLKINLNEVDVDELLLNEKEKMSGNSNIIKKIPNESIKYYFNNINWKKNLLLWCLKIISKTYFI